MENAHSSIENSTLFVRINDTGFQPATSQQIINSAMQAIDQFVKPGTVLESPQIISEYVRLQLHALEHEVFAVFFLDVQCRLIKYLELFRGTINKCRIHAREVVRTALMENAASVIFAHNHPSALSIASVDDITSTHELIKAMALIEVRVRDHLIVGEDGVFSFIDRGLMV